MFPVFVNDGTQEMPDDDILYIVCKEGTYLKKKLGIMESITPVKNISILETVEMMATMHIKPIPGTKFAPVIDFFRKVYDEHRGEAIVLLFYNEEKKTYKIVAPSQEVSSAGVDYTRAITIDGYIMVGDIHSHANFSAFHSGVDDADEKSFDGLHITIGNNGDNEVSISASIVSNGQRFICNPEDYINGVLRTVDIDEVVEKSYAQTYIWNTDLKKLVLKPSTKTYKVKRFDRRYISTISKRYQKCPDEWLALVTKKKWAAYTTGSFGYGNIYNNWNTSKFDPDAWKNHKKQQGKIQSKVNPALLPVTTKPITFPPHAQTTGPMEEIIEEDFNPCEKCPFVQHKVDWLMEQIATDDGLDEMSKYLDNDGNPIDWYQCDKCSHVFSTIDEFAVCPNCNVDDHLILLDGQDLDFKNMEAINTGIAIEGIEWYRCEECSEIFDTTSLSPKCPVCEKDDSLVLLNLNGNSAPYIPEEVKESISNYQYKCKECATQTSILNHGQCPFCGGDVIDSIDVEALKAAAAEDETMESIPLPVPGDNKIPLGSRKKQKRKPGILSRLLMKGKK